MKQTAEEAAKENILFNHRTVDRTLFGKDLAKFGEMNFVQGAEWQSKQSPWISVKERLPEEGQKVFVLVMYYGTPCIREEKFCRNSNLNRKGMWIHGNNIVMAWFPTPSFDDILEANRDVLEHFKTKEE